MFLSFEYKNSIQTRHQYRTASQAPQNTLTGTSLLSIQRHCYIIGDEKRKSAIVFINHLAIFEPSAKVFTGIDSIAVVTSASWQPVALHF
jgi:hypothetical protein